MKTTVSTVQKMKDNGEKITMLTAYDYSTAKLFDEAGIDTMLVGDSLGMVMLGYDPSWSSRCKRGKKRYDRCRHAIFILSHICI